MHFVAVFLVLGLLHGTGWPADVTKFKLITLKASEIFSPLELPQSMRNLRARILSLLIYMPVQTVTFWARRWVPSCWHRTAGCSTCIFIGKFSIPDSLFFVPMIMLHWLPVPCLKLYFPNHINFFSPRKVTPPQLSLKKLSWKFW